MLRPTPVIAHTGAPASGPFQPSRWRRILAERPREVVDGARDQRGRLGAARKEFGVLLANARGISIADLPEGMADRIEMAREYLEGLQPPLTPDQYKIRLFVDGYAQQAGFRHLWECRRCGLNRHDNPSRRALLEQTIGAELDTMGPEPVTLVCLAASGLLQTLVIVAKFPTRFAAIDLIDPETYGKSELRQEFEEGVEAYAPGLPVRFHEFSSHYLQDAESDAAPRLVLEVGVHQEWRVEDKSKTQGLVAWDYLNARDADLAATRAALRRPDDRMLELSMYMVGRRPRAVIFRRAAPTAPELPGLKYQPRKSDDVTKVWGRVV